MKRFFILLCGSALVSTLGCQPKVDIDTEKAEVNAILESYVASIETEDIDLYGKVMAHDAEMTNFGGFGDPIVGWDALKAVIEGQNEALSEIKIIVSDLAIHIPKTAEIAWATNLWTFKAMMGENPVELPIRCTWVLEKRQNAWVIVHFHKSMAMEG